jgi:hypothetical protein
VARVIELPVQGVPLSVFGELSEDDVLFVDSTHVVRTGSDVNYEILEILPRVAPGVLVHFHDIFFPFEYPSEWVRGRHVFWTEQYLLQSFLAFNSEFQIFWASRYMQSKYTEQIAEVMRVTNLQPSSLWIRRRVPVTVKE